MVAALRTQDGGGGSVVPEDASLQTSLKAPDLGVLPYQAVLCCVLVSGMRSEVRSGGPAVCSERSLETWKDKRLELRVSRRESRNSTPNCSNPGSATFCMTLSCRLHNYCFKKINSFVL